MMFARDFRAAIAFGGECLQLCVADANQRQFRRHEKSVQHHEREDRQDFQAVINEGVPVHRAHLAKDEFQSRAA